MNRRAGNHPGMLFHCPMCEFKHEDSYVLQLHCEESHPDGAEAYLRDFDRNEMAVGEPVKLSPSIAGLGRQSQPALPIASPSPQSENLGYLPAPQSEDSGSLPSPQSEDSDSGSSPSPQSEDSNSLPSPQSEDSGSLPSLQGEDSSPHSSPQSDEFADLHSDESFSCGEDDCDQRLQLRDRQDHIDFHLAAWLTLGNAETEGSSFSLSASHDGEKKEWSQRWLHRRRRRNRKTTGSSAGARKRLEVRLQ